MTADFIDLRSDTATRPTPSMREAMARAEVGDDMCGEDPTVNRLEAMVAEMFGTEAAVFACSGTQSNQMGIRVHCQPGDELLINTTGHIANYEAGGPAVLSGITVRTIDAPNGMLDVSDVDGTPRADNQHLCPTRLLCVENTTNSGGGRVYSIAHLERLAAWARNHGLKVHVDGARLFNACVAGGYSPADVAACADTISICFSKGLGCPMGSILVGSAEAIAHARRSRKIFGGALRQSGIVAAAAVHALEHHVERLAEDHENAKTFAERIAEVDGFLIDPAAVETNLVFFDVEPRIGTAADVVARAGAAGVRMLPMGPRRIRACTHLDVTQDDVLRAAEAIAQCAGAATNASALVASSPYAQG